MREYINVFTDSIIYVFDSFVSMVTDKKPLLSILFPVSGLGASFIPTSTQTVDEAVYMMEFIANATPYLKFLFLILTIVLTVLSTVLQIRKLLSNHKNKNNKNERS